MLFPRLQKAVTYKEYSRMEEEHSSLISTGEYEAKREALRKKGFMIRAITLIIVIFTVFSSPVPEISAVLASAGLLWYLILHIRYTLKTKGSPDILTYIAPFIFLFCIFIACVRSSDVDYYAQLVLEYADKAFVTAGPPVVMILTAIFMILYPLVAIIRYIARRMRCDSTVSARFLGYSELLPEKPKNYSLVPDRHPVYTYEYNGMEYVFAYKPNISPDSINVRIDTDYPQYICGRGIAYAGVVSHILLILTGCLLLWGQLIARPEVAETIRDFFNV